MRRKPYTQRGLLRVPCCRCGKPSTQQWEGCADNNVWRGLCDGCDYKLNAVFLSLCSRIPRRQSKLNTYARRLGLKPVIKIIEL